MKILSKEFMLGSGVYIGLYLIIATIFRYGLMPQWLKPLEYGLGPDFLLVLAPLMVICFFIGLGCSLYLLHQLFVVIGTLVLDNLRYFKRK